MREDLGEVLFQNTSTLSVVSSCWKHYDMVWRKYSDFYNNMMADFTPKLKLYKLWKIMLDQ
jgi:hypothetical protein